jgi:hypothetical protein
VKVRGEETADGRLIVISDADEELVSGFGAMSLDLQSRGSELVIPYPPDASHFEDVVANWERDGEAMGRQLPKPEVPWQEALRAFLDRVEDQSVEWFLMGSTALAVRGIQVTPKDIDITTDGRGIRGLENLFLDHLIWPVSDTRGWPVCSWFARVFWHCLIELAGDVPEEIDYPVPRPWGPFGQERLERVNWKGHEIFVPDLALHRQDENSRGRTSYVSAIDEFIDMS